MGLRAEDECYMYRTLIKVPVKVAFVEKLDNPDNDDNENADFDEEFDWVLVKNKVVMPLSFRRVTCGTASTNTSVSTGWFFGYKELFEFDFDIMSLIDEKAQLVKNKPIKTNQLYSAIWYCVTDRTDESIEMLKNFK